MFYPSKFLPFTRVSLSSLSLVISSLYRIPQLEGVFLGLKKDNFLYKSDN